MTGRGTSRAATAAVVLLVGGVIAAAAVSSLRSADQPGSVAESTTAVTTRPGTAGLIGDALRLPPPPAGALTGRFLVVTSACGIETVDAATGAGTAVTPDDTTCAAWFSPSARFAAVVPRPLRVAKGAELVRIDLDTGRSTRLDVTVGTDNDGPPSIADDGTVSSCIDRGLTLAPPDGATVRRPHLCAAAGLGAQIVALGSDRRQLVDPFDGAALFSLGRAVRGYGPVLMASPDASMVAAVAFDRRAFHAEVTVLPVREGRARPPVTAGIGNRYRRVVLSNDGRLVALHTEGGWDVCNLARETRFQRAAGRTILDVAFSPDSRLIAAATDVGVVILDGATLAPRYLLELDAIQIAWR